MDSAQRRPAGLGVAALSLRGAPGSSQGAPSPPLRVCRRPGRFGAPGVCCVRFTSPGASARILEAGLSAGRLTGKVFLQQGGSLVAKMSPTVSHGATQVFRLGLRWMLGTHLGNNAQSSRSEKWHESIKIQRLLFPVNVRKQVWPESPWATTDRAGKAAEGRPSAGSACGVRGVCVLCGARQPAPAQCPWPGAAV